MARAGLGIRDIYTGLGKLLTRASAKVEVLDVHRGAAVDAITWTGTDRATGGGVEWQTFHAMRLRNGLVHEIHSFSTDTEALAKAEELSPWAAHAGIASRYVEAVNAQDWDALSKLYTAECKFVEHRPVAWKDASGAARFIAAKQRAFELTRDPAEHVEIGDDDGGDVFVIRQTESGTWQGGPWESRTDCVVTLHDGLIAHSEMFTPDQTAELRSRLAELRAGRRPGRPSESWEAPLAEYVTLIDHRARGSGVLHGLGAVSARLGQRLSGESLAATNEVTLLRDGEDRFTGGGTQSRGRGRFRRGIRGTGRRTAALRGVDRSARRRGEYSIRVQMVRCAQPPRPGGGAGLPGRRPDGG